MQTPIAHHSATTRAPLGTSALTPGERALVGAFVNGVRAILNPESLARIVVFGSRARGSGHGDSDLDIAVFAKGPLAPDLHHRLAEIAEEAQTDREDLPHLRPILITPDQRLNPLLLAAIDTDGIAVWPIPTT